MSLSLMQSAIRKGPFSVHRLSQHEFTTLIPPAAKRAMTSSHKKAFSSSASTSTTDQSPPSPRSEVRRTPRVNPQSFFSTTDYSSNNNFTTNSRLSLISRHFHTTPQLELSTPYSTERSSLVETDLDQPPASKQSIADTKRPSIKMSSQPPHPAVLIPGPIEYDDEVLQSMSHFRYTTSLTNHASARYSDVFRTANPMSACPLSILSERP